MIAAPIQIDKEKYVCVVMVIANLEQKRLYVHESFLTKNLQEIVASNSVRGSNASSPQPQGDVAKVLQNYLIDKQNVENNNIKENKNMNKNKIRLTESQLHRVIKESVKKVLRELDYKTYQNAAKKAHLRALDDYDDNDTNMNKYLEKSKNFRNAAEDAFIRDYGYDDGQYHTKMHSDMHGSNAKAPGGGYFPYHDDSSLRIYDRNDKFNILGIPHERSVARDDYIKKMIIPFCTTFWNVLNAEYDLSRLNIRILSQMFL
jgi:hypothetical protein